MRFCILSVIVLVFGCTNSKVTSELNRADELMNDHPDSAYVLIQSINPDDIHGRADKAFYALLYTQAQYKNYDTIRNDSLIDIAVKYYSENPTKDRLTRSYMYKAGALSDMERHKEAIEWLKKAEQVADTSDYLMLGLINSQMGTLYQRNFVANNEHIERYKKALKNYSLAGNTKFMIFTLSNIGKLYLNLNLDSAAYYLQEGIILSGELHDSTRFNAGLKMLSYSHLLRGNYVMSKDIALSTLGHSQGEDVSILCGLGTSYAKLGKVDSAEYYFNKITTLKSSGDSVNYFVTMADVSVAQGDFKKAYSAMSISTEIADRVINNARKHDVYAVEEQFDYTVVQERAEKLESQNTIKNYLIIIIILVLTISIYIAISVVRHKNRIAAERIQLAEQLKVNIEQQQTFLMEYKTKFAERNESEDILKSIIKDRIDIIRMLVMVKHEFGANPNLFLKKFDEIIIHNRKNQEDAEQIILIANKLFNNIIDKTAENYPQLKYRELLIIALSCFNFKPIEMGVYINSTSANAVYIARHKIAKTLNVNSIDDYTSIFTTNE